MVPPRFRSQAVAFAHDALMVPLAWLLAAWFRFNLGVIPSLYLDSLVAALAVVVPVQTGAFVVFGLYKGIWRFASLPDIVRIIKAVAVGTALSMVALFLLTRGASVPRSIPVIYALLLVMLLGGPRLLYRWVKDRHLYLSAGARVLIVGAGGAGEALARNLARGAMTDFQPSAFVDDDPRRQGRDIHGVPVVGTIADIPALVKSREIDVIVLAMPSANSQEIRRVVDYCEQAGVPFRSVPQLQDLLSGRVAINHLREISIEDLLGRDPVSLDWPVIERQLSQKRILVSGGGGSIGSELCRQLARLQPGRLIVLENSEFNLYTIEMELRRDFPGLELLCCLGDVTDADYLEHLFAEQRPQVVFHAAAYKHVPMLESQVRQAVRNNILGTQMIAEISDRIGVEEFVLVSTDKAVNPTNVMGATKRAAEIYCQNLGGRSRTKFITVRFGNVLGSAGSVIPLFRKQIGSGGPVTVTDPRMQRYFMTIPEACQLIMQTSAMGSGGEIFVLDMGEPVKISYLAEQMIRLSGKEPGVDIEIVYTGLRPGEKLFEELFHEKERLVGTPHQKVFLARYREVDWDWLRRLMKDFADACAEMDGARLQRDLEELVPEYRPEQPSARPAAPVADVIYLKSLEKQPDRKV